MKLQQTNINQTGVAILELTNLEEKQVPLFSLNPISEAEELLEDFIGASVKHVFITNNLMDYKIESVIEKYKSEHNGALSELLMDQLVSGFPYVVGYEVRSTTDFYI